MPVSHLVCQDDDRFQSLRQYKRRGIDSLEEFDLLCVGGPTEWLTASKPMKEFLGMLRAASLSGKYGFAFDMKLDRPLSGSAAKFIEKGLKNMGLRIVAPRESATAFLVNGKVGGAYLKEGEEQRFKQIGADRQQSQPSCTVQLQEQEH